MKNLIPLLTLLILLSTLVSAQTDRELPAVSNIEDYRAVGELRQWNFYTGDTIIGQYSSQIIGTKEIDGREAYIFDQKMDIELRRRDGIRPFKARVKFCVDQFGSFLGIERDQMSGSATEQMELERKGDSLFGLISRDGIGVDQAMYFDFGEPAFSVDQHFLDQWEIFLSMQTLKVGDTINTKFFAPGMMMASQALATVDQFRSMYNPVTGSTDSVFIVTFQRPQRSTLYFSTDRQLVGAQFYGQQLQARLASSRTISTKSPKNSSLTIGRVIAMIPAWFLYVVFGLIAAALFVGKQMRKGTLLLALAAGAVSYVVVPWTQTPLQVAFFENLLLPKVSAGGSPYVWSIPPALVAGIIQEVLRLAVLVGLIRHFGAKPNAILPIAVMASTGFGIIEAAYLGLYAPLSQLFSFNLLERGFTILFHTTAGALLGWALCQGWRSERWLLALVSLVAVNSFLKYLPVFVQQRDVALQLMYMIIPLCVLALLAITIFLHKRPDPEPE